MRPLLLCAAFLGILGAPSRASAADYGDPPAPDDEHPPAASPDDTRDSSEPPAWDARIGGALGGFGTRDGGGASFSATATGRWTAFEAGALFQAGLGPSAGFTTGAFLAGFALPLGTARSGGVRFDLLGELGVDSISGVGGGILSGPGASGSVGVYGVRLGIGYRFPRRRVAAGYIGLWLTAEQDGSTQSSSYTHCGLSNCQQETVQIGGGSRLGLSFGGGIDFGPH
jgi:hypothetical protein